jgi:hypothetical protein
MGINNGATSIEYRKFAKLISEHKTEGGKNLLQIFPLFTLNISFFNHSM